MLPFVDVAHLPSSASFYSAVFQPLGLRYIHGDDPLSPTSAITFGDAYTRTPIIQLRGPANPPHAPKLSRILLSAPSSLAVADFHAAALRANPTLLTADHAHWLRHSRDIATAIEGGESWAKATDLDGNTMEVVYRPPNNYPPGHNGSTVRRTQSTHDEVSRILDWNYNVASNAPPRSTVVPLPERQLATTRRPGRFPDDESYTVLRRSVTTSTLEPSPRQSPTSNGLSTGAVVGTILGVAAASAAAGAAITYSMMNKERARAPSQEFDAPPFQRRSTFPNRLPSDHPPGRYVELERPRDVYRYAEEDYALAAHHNVPSHYSARYAPPRELPRSYEHDDAYDNRSRHSSLNKAGRSISARSSSESPTGRAPLMIKDREHSSRAGSRHSVSTRSVLRPAVDVDRESYVSARSHRSSSTIRPPPLPATVHSEVVSRSRGGSRVTTIQVSGTSPMSFPPNASRTHSRVSARQVPLPASGVGSSHASWDDDVASVAPSDSISCAGSSRRRRKSYY